MLLLLANIEQLRKKRMPRYWLWAPIIVLMDLVLVIFIARYNNFQFAAAQHNVNISEQLVSLQNQYMRNEQKLNSLYSTLSYYTKNSRFGVAGIKPRIADEAFDPGFSWVRYYHQYIFPDRLQFAVKDQKGRHTIVLENIKAWLVSNDTHLRDSYVYDSSVVTANLFATPTCSDPDPQYSYMFRSYYLYDWISVYPERILQTGCLPYLFARAEEHLINGNMSCVIYFFSKDSNIPITHVTTLQPL